MVRNPNPSGEMHIPKMNGSCKDTIKVCGNPTFGCIYRDTKGDYER